jgi:hypothetical protein
LRLRQAGRGQDAGERPGIQDEIKNNQDLPPSPFDALRLLRVTRQGRQEQHDFWENQKNKLKPLQSVFGVSCFRFFTYEINVLVAHLANDTTYGCSV